MAETAKIVEHMELIGSGGRHVGKVDHMQGSEQIKLAKSDVAAHGGHHH